MTVRIALFDGIIWLSLLALPLQACIDPSAENLACCCIVLVSSLSVVFYLRASTALRTHPLSSMALLGFAFSAQLGALLVQTVAWTALRSTLYDPLYTFGTLALYLSIATIVHVTFRFFAVRKHGDFQVVRGMLGWMGLYKVPACGSLWFMGCVGLPTFAFWNSEGVIGKIAAGFTFLTWAPFLIPFYSRKLGPDFCNFRVNLIMLAVYSLIIGVLGLALNARGVMFEGVVTVGLLVLLSALNSEARVTSRALSRLAMLAACLGILSIPVSDLATAMVVARAQRGKVSAGVMIRTTLHIWRQPALINAYRKEQATASRFSAYDEHYIANPMLARLVETKFYDNAFHFARSIRSDGAKARLREVSVKLAWAVLPRPVLSRLHIRVNKDELNYSMGDYLAYLSRGVPLGGHKTGNMFAQGIALFGPLFPLIYVGICFALYTVMDLLTVRTASGEVSISTLGMLSIWNYFIAGITYESLHKVLQFFGRYLWQIFLIYFGVFWFTRLFESKNKRSSDAALPLPLLQQRAV